MPTNGVQVAHPTYEIGQVHGSSILASLVDSCPAVQTYQV
jgi:hypothetical protein